MKVKSASVQTGKREPISPFHRNTWTSPIITIGQEFAETWSTRQQVNRRWNRKRSHPDFPLPNGGCLKGFRRTLGTPSSVLYSVSRSYYYTSYYYYTTYHHTHWNAPYLGGRYSVFSSLISRPVRSCGSLVVQTRSSGASGQGVISASKVSFPSQTPTYPTTRVFP